MDYSSIVRQAWRLTWRYKWLWLPGLLAVLGVGGNTAGVGAPTGINLRGGAPVTDLSADRLVVILGIGSVLLLLGVILWVVSVIGRGALIAGVDRLAQTGVCTLGQAWAAGVENFGRLFLIGLVTALPGLVLAFLTFIAAVPAMAGDAFGGALAATVIACFLPLCCALTVVGLLLGLIQQFADRAAVIEGRAPLAAFGRGWDVLRAHLGDVFLLFVTWAALAWFFQLLIAFVIASVIPMILQLAGGAFLDFGALFLALIATLVGVVVAAIFGVFNTFASAMWTLAYRRFIARP